jgi:hypothetical protein
MLTLEWTDGNGDPQAIDFDASERETYEGTTEVTEHAVEQGAPVSDHVRPNAETFVFEAWVSNQPISVPGTQLDGASGSTQAIDVRVGSQTVRAAVLKFNQGFDRRGAVDELLRALKDAGQRLTVVSGLRTATDVVIERYAVERDAESGAGLHLTLGLKRVRIATTAGANVVPAQRRGQRRQNRGAQPATSAADRRTFALRLLQGVAGNMLPGFLGSSTPAAGGGS